MTAKEALDGFYAALCPGYRFAADYDRLLRFAEESDKQNHFSEMHAKLIREMWKEL